MHTSSLHCGTILVATSNTSELRYELHRFLTGFLPALKEALPFIDIIYCSINEYRID